MNQPKITVAYGLVPGPSEDVLVTSLSHTQSAFDSVFTDAKPMRISQFGPTDGTVLSIIVTVASVGAGIVLSEVLKECGKDLWRVLKRLVNQGPNTEEQPPSSADTIKIEVRIGDSTVTAAMPCSRGDSEDAVKQFVEEALTQVYDTYESEKPDQDNE